eukprot:TRINITY_DN5775_c0_g1_i1.p6 TRINITY_DN5775_c0_g1~~TRINITY_DN5775_c0_g1_i1.p6  ORF type:complete len:147 (-),score=10.78 TRINITY_DN5775_c0_g1_i1:942-1382(-)
MIFEDSQIINNFIFEVGNSLQGIIQIYQSNYFIYDNQMVLNIGCQLNNINNNNQKLAIQVLDRNCYSINQPYKLLGHSKMRLKLINQMGWQIIQIPFFEWEILLEPEQKKAYLKRKIQKYLIQQSHNQNQKFVIFGSAENVEVVPK